MLKSALMAALLAAVLLAAVPPAAAQGTAPAPILSFEEFKAPATPVKPEVGAGQVTFKIKYALQTPAQGGIIAVASTAVVTVTPSCENSNVFIQGPGTVLVTLAAGQTTTTTGPVTYTVTANRLAPGLQLLKCQITAKAGPLQGTAVPESNSIKQDFQVTVDYFPYIQAKLTSATLDAGPQKPIPFAIVITNFGNAQTQIVFTLANTPSEEWSNVILPPALTLDSSNSGGAKTEDTATMTVNTPYSNGWNNEEQTFQVTMTPIAALDNTRVGTPISVSMFARSRGIYVPGPEPLLVGLALVGAALVAKMARRDE